MNLKNLKAHFVSKPFVGHNRPFFHKTVTTHHGILVKIKCHLEWNFTKKAVSLKMECHSKIECYSECNVTQNQMSFKMK